MPGTFHIDTSRTFATLLLMGSAPKTEFGTDQQAISRTGERKWELQVAATWHAENGMRPVSEVISVTLLGADPGLSLAPGTPVEFDQLRLGISTPEMSDNGRGPRVRGGKAWYSAAAVRAVNGHKPMAKVDG